MTTTNDAPARTPLGASTMISSDNLPDEVLRRALSMLERDFQVGGPGRAVIMPYRDWRKLVDRATSPTAAVQGTGRLREALAGLVKRVDEAIEHGYWKPQPDWACAECRPDSDILKPGFRCSLHEARAALAAPPSTTPTDAPTTKEERLREAIEDALRFLHRARWHLPVLRSLVEEESQAEEYEVAPLNIKKAQQVLEALATPQAPEGTDENGCYTLPNGECVSPGPCLHTKVPQAPEPSGERRELAETLRDVTEERSKHEASWAAEYDMLIRCAAALASPDSASEPVSAWIVWAKDGDSEWYEEPWLDRAEAEREAARFVDEGFAARVVPLYAHPPAEPPEEEREWRVNTAHPRPGIGGVMNLRRRFKSEDEARAWATRYTLLEGTVQFRRVGPWQDVEAEEGGSDAL